MAASGAAGGVVQRFDQVVGSKNHDERPALACSGDTDLDAGLEGEVVEHWEE